jgi:hypothetical protein
MLHFLCFNILLQGQIDPKKRKEKKKHYQNVTEMKIHPIKSEWGPLIGFE